MGSLQQPGRFLSYSNNIQRTSGLQSQGGYHQSLSGSETDVSTSNENLSNEERYVIRHTPRQEPQGQENLQQSVSNRSSLKESLPSNRSSLDVSSSSYNTLIIHDDLWNNRLSGIRDQSETNAPMFLSYSVDSKVSSGGQKSITKDRNSLNSIGVQEITEIPDDYLNQSHVLKHLAKEVKVPSSSGSTMRDSGVSENVELDRLSLTRKDNNFQSHFEYDLPNPIVWKNRSPGWSLINRHRGKNEKFSLSKSQPDLSRISGNSYDVQYRRGASAPRPRTKGREELDIGEIWQSNEIVDILIHENNTLKLEIDNCQQKVAKSQKLEQEISKVHQAHAELVAMSEKRERLERTARMRLQADCRRFQELNHALREQSDLLQTQLLATRAATPNDLPTDALRKELAKREVLIAQLITQNKELVASKERQEIELAAQRATLQEQRTHIDILDTALTNAQGNVVRLEEECRKKQMYVERVAQLQRALSSLQLASDRREQTERKLRLQLERELRNERSKPDESGGGISNSLNETSAAELKRRLREREEKIMRLEGECAKWEQRYLEESALRQAAIDAASIPKDAKIAALEKTSQDAEKLIAEARTEKIRHMDEVHEAQKKVADLEARLKDFESKLAERDAMIRVLQKHAYDKDVSASSSFSNILGRSPHHTPHASLHSATATTDLDTVLGTSVSREELVSSVLTGSTGFGSSNSYAGSDSSYHTSYSKYGSAANKSFDSTKKSLDDQLKELDNQLDNHQLLNKRGLCCFPGFSNPSTASRKGKIPKPLLAGVSSAAAGQFGVLQGFRREPSPGDPRGSGGRPEEEMLLLEKAGRSSQQQRCSGAPESGSGSATPRGSSGGSGSVTVTNSNNNNNNNGQSGAGTGTGAGSSASARAGSLPPSSLPRPPRSVRRLVDYNRLDDSPSSSRKQADISSSGESSKRASPARSLIPPPRKVGEYNRLGGKPRADRDSASTASDNSASSLPPPSSSSKLRMYGTSTGVSSLTRRGSSLGRDAKTGQTTKYRIQF